MSRNVNGLPVGVDPTLSTVWACAPAAMDNAANTETTRVLNFMTYPHRGKESRAAPCAPGGGTIPCVAPPFQVLRACGACCVSSPEAGLMLEMAQMTSVV
ncbi:hypothetical protein D3C72_2040860 [compost metagenome]